MQNFAPALDHSGSAPDLALWALMSASTGSGHNAKSGFISTVPISDIRRGAAKRYSDLLDDVVGTGLMRRSDRAVYAKL
jgi:hypothetical protein